MNHFFRQIELKCQFMVKFYFLDQAHIVWIPFDVIVLPFPHLVCVCDWTAIGLLPFIYSYIYIQYIVGYECVTLGFLVSVHLCLNPLVSLTDIDCLVMHLDYVHCSWNKQGAPEVNYTFYGWFVISDSNSHKIKHILRCHLNWTNCKE